MTPSSRAALITAVAEVCLESMRQDAARPQPIKRRWVGRAAQIKEIATDTRIRSHSRCTQRALITDVMRAYGVTDGNARKLICEARKHATQQARN